MYTDQWWMDIHSRAVKNYMVFDDLPTGLQRLVCCGMVYLVLATLGCAIGSVASYSQVFILAGAVGASVPLGVIAHWLLIKDERVLQKRGLLVSRRSQGFIALERELAARGIYIRQMNDRHDHDVGIQYISDYLRLVREPSELLVPANQLDEAQANRLQASIGKLAGEYASLIRYFFDQRELRRQALEKAEHTEADRIEGHLRACRATIAAVGVEVWLENDGKGLVG